MKKKCSCGSEMDITLRTLYFNRKIEIKNVPIYSCTTCGNNELIPPIKEKIKEVIDDHKNIQRKETVYFEQKSELAQLLILAYHKQDFPYKDEKLQEEIEELLEHLYFNELNKDHGFEQKLHKKIERYMH